jgi:guanylate kinase
MPRGRIFVVSGPSGAGKDTLVKEFLRHHPSAVMAVTATTRARRKGEEPGEDYFFLTEQEFDKKLERSEFLEWAWVHGNRYGTLRSEVERAVAAGKDVILRIDVQGAAAIKKQIPEAVLVFIFPPNMEELEQRLRRRDTDAEEELLKRLSKAEWEIAEGKRLYDYSIVNDELERALQRFSEYYERESGGRTEGC